MIASGTLDTPRPMRSPLGAASAFYRVVVQRGTSDSDSEIVAIAACFAPELALVSGTRRARLATSDSTIVLVVDQREDRRAPPREVLDALGVRGDPSQILVREESVLPGRTAFCHGVLREGPDGLWFEAAEDDELVIAADDASLSA